MIRARRPVDLLPISLPPRSLSRMESAAYVGVLASLFDLMVKHGRMPRPKRINARTVWDTPIVSMVTLVPSAFRLLRYGAYPLKVSMICTVNVSLR